MGLNWILYTVFETVLILSHESLNYQNKPMVRLGIYNVLLEKFSKDGQAPGFFAKAGMGLTAGAVGAFCGTPADVALVRMCVDNRLPEAERRNYKRNEFRKMRWKSRVKSYEDGLKG